jgi:hypothetical protein
MRKVPMTAAGFVSLAAAIGALRVDNVRRI